MAKGIDFKIFVNTGTEELPEFTQVAGQRGGTLNRSHETIDMTSKDGDGWADVEYGQGSWSIDGDGVYSESDVALTAIEDAFMEKAAVKVEWRTPAGNRYYGDAVITSFPIAAPYNDLATYTLTLTGKGKPQKGTVTP